MKWITRKKVKVDRVACPWLIKCFIDPSAECVFLSRRIRTGARSRTGLSTTYRAAS
jgi:hypothetical protein